MKKDLKYYMNLNYITEVKKIPQEDGGGYYVTIPQLGKYAFRADGETLEKAFANLESIKKYLFNEYLKNGTQIPEPKEINEPEYSGRFVMRIPKQLHRILANEARKDGVSLNQYVQFLLTSACVADSFENIIDTYNNKFDRMLKSYEEVHHHYEVPNYYNSIIKNQKLTLVSTTKYAEAV